MADRDPDLAQRLEALARRIDRIEQHLKLPDAQAAATNRGPSRPTADRREQTQWQHEQSDAPSPTASDTPAVKPLAAHLAERRRQQSSPSSSSDVPRRSAPPTTPPTPPTSRQSPESPGGAETTSPAQASTARPSTRAVATPSARKSDEGSGAPTRGGLEVFLGGKAAAWIGALIVVVGAAFAIREFGSGFWANLPTWGRALTIAAGGAALLGIGEIAYRRIGRLASVGLIGAGLGVLYLDAYATFAWFSPAVVSREGAFILMAVVAVIGFALTLRTRFLTIGVLALLGGYLTPLLLAGGDPHPVLLGTFLTMLLGIALALSAAQPKPFRALRYVAIGGQVALGIVLLSAVGAGESLVVLVFLSIWWAMLLAESVLAALRDQSPIGNAAACLVMTLTYVLLGGLAIHNAGPAGAHWLGAFLLGVGLISGATAGHFGPGLDGLRGRLTNAMDKLAVTLWSMAGALLIAAVGFQFNDAGQSVGWLAIALAAIESGRRLPSRGVTVFALITGALAIAKILSVDLLSGALDTELARGTWFELTHWSVLGLSAIVAVAVAAWRVGPQTSLIPRAAPVLLTLIALGLWMIWCTLTFTGMAVTAGWLIGAGALLAIERPGRRQRTFEIGTFGLLATAARWLLIDAVARRIDPTWDPGTVTPILNGQMALALAIAAGGGWVFRMLHARQREHAMTAGSISSSAGGLLWQFALLISGAFLLLGLSFEVDRMVLRLAESGAVHWSAEHVRQLLWTMLWTFGVSGIGLIASLLAPRAARRPLLALRATWLLLLILSGKWMLYDTLYWTLELGRDDVAASSTLVNLQLLTGVILAGAAVVLLAAGATPRDPDHEGEEPDAWSRVRAAVPVLAAVIVLWGLTFEIDRWLLQRLDGGAEPSWPLAQWRALWWTGLWITGAIVIAGIGWWRNIRSLSVAALAIIIGGAIVWLSYGTIFWRVVDGSVANVPVALNLQFVVGLIAAAALLTLERTTPRWWPLDRDAGSEARQTASAIALGLIGAIGLWLGSLEIDRFFAAQPMARQMGWSVYWSLFALALVLIGFLRPSSASRYAGLALLTIVVIKVLLVDLSQVEQIWRILSFIVSGLLLLGTSAAYAKFAPRMLEAREADRRRFV